MKTSWEKVAVDGSAMGMYLAQPESSGPVPAIVVIQNQDGVKEFTQEMTRGSPKRVISGLHRRFIIARASPRHRSKPRASRIRGQTLMSSAISTRRLIF